MEEDEVVRSRYRIVELLGQGGMARVWKAVDKETGRLVAVKEIRADQYNYGRLSPAERSRQRTELLNRFEREGQFLADLDHPGIVSLLDRGLHRDAPYLVMEFVDGCPLDKFLDRFRPLPIGAAIAIAVDIAEALVHAHAGQVIHRDLKPGNIVLTVDGSAKVIDFGVALPDHPDATRYTAYGATPGTVGYMAPEQLQGQQKVTKSVDHYSFGCVLFELLTGRQPFTDRPDRNCATQHQQDLPPRVSDHRGGIPSEIDDLVWQLLSKDPYQRFDSLTRALDVLRPHLPAAGSPAPNPELVPDPTARHRLPGAAPAPAAVAKETRRPARRRPVGRAVRLGADRDQFDELLALAAAEMAGPGVGPATRRLDEELEAARRSWGLGHLPVARAQLICADAARLRGAWEDAGPLYRAAAKVLEHKTAPEFRVLALEARVGAAECLVPAGDLQGAFDGWADVVHEVAGLVEMPGRVLARCRETALELAECGRHAEVRRYLALLPRG
ncbi:serine/threonine-protein kinase [Kitasatospora sp. NPDC093102]|uniref:serine/threonine-protein kinase n=1 Tax=Kitasatospora sp. NPDC093102 TaxID=3155069 RepID=UPI00341E364A